MKQSWSSELIIPGQRRRPRSACATAILALGALLASCASVAQEEPGPPPPPPFNGAPPPPPAELRPGETAQPQQPPAAPKTDAAASQAKPDQPKTEPAKAGDFNIPKGDQPPPQPGQSVRMNFRDTPLENVLEQLSDLTGLVIVKDFTLEGRVSIISKQLMNLDEAVALLNSVLKEKGYVGIRTGRVLKLVKLDEAKKRNIPVRTGNDPALIEANDDVITQVIPIRFIDAAQLKKDFAPLVPSYADLSANTASNSLILTDTGANIRRIAEIIRAMDTQSTTASEVRVFQLKYANATSAARLITDTFKTDDTSSSQQQANVPPWMRGGGFFGRGGGGGGGGGNPQQDDTRSGGVRRKVTASADDRTNSIVVSATTEVMLVISQVVKDLDANPAEDQGVFVYHCRNAQARNLESVINALFGGGAGTSSLNRSQTTQRGNTGIGTNVSRSSSSSRLPGSSVSGGSSRLGSSGGSFGGSSFGGNSSFGGGFGGNGSGSYGGSSRGTGSVSGDLTGQVFVVADTDSNALMVLTAPKLFDRVKAIIAELDKPVPQVLIKVLIAEVTHDKSRDIGADISALNHGELKSILTNVGAAAATDGMITKLVGTDMTATLHALETLGKLEILSRPYILASDNQLSSITVGNEVPFIVSSRTTDTGQTINTIEYQDIGIILNVTAHINDEGLVIMDVAPEVSSLTGTTVPISETVSAPVFAKRSAQSRVGVKDGQTIVIGGLMEDKSTETIKGVPFLDRVPGLGTLLRRKQTDKSKTELLIFLTPHVALSPGTLKPMAEQERAGLKLVPKAIEKGAFEEHMEGLERGEVVPVDPDAQTPPMPIPSAPTVPAPPTPDAPVPPQAPNETRQLDNSNHATPGARYR